MTKEQFEEMVDLIVDDPVIIASAIAKFKPVVAKFLREIISDEIKKIIPMVTNEIKKIIRDINPFK